MSWSLPAAELCSPPLLLSSVVDLRRCCVLSSLRCLAGSASLETEGVGAPSGGQGLTCVVLIRNDVITLAVLPHGPIFDHARALPPRQNSSPDPPTQTLVAPSTTRHTMKLLGFCFALLATGATAFVSPRTRAVTRATRGGASMMVEITKGVEFDTVAREWRMKWSPDDEKKSLQEIQTAVDDVVGTLKGLDGVKDVQRIVCGGCLDYKLVTSLDAEAVSGGGGGGRGGVEAGWARRGRREDCVGRCRVVAPHPRHRPRATNPHGVSHPHYTTAPHPRSPSPWVAVGAGAVPSQAAVAPYPAQTTATPRPRPAPSTPTPPPLSSASGRRLGSPPRMTSSRKSRALTVFRSSRPRLSPSCRCNWHVDGAGWEGSGG